MLTIIIPKLLLYLITITQASHILLPNSILPEIHKLAVNTLNLAKENITNNCYQIINESINRKDNAYILKLYEDSSPVHNNLKGYISCYYSYYNTNSGGTTYDIKDNVTFIIFSYKTRQTKSSISFNTYSNIFGACVPKGCNKDDYITLFFSFRKLYPLLDNLIEETTHVTDLQEELQYSGYTIFFQCIPCFFFSLFIFFIFFPKLFECCSKCGISNNKINNIIQCFDLRENVTEVFPSSKNQSKVHNENGLELAIGLRGIGMILLICGLVLKNIFVTPIKKYTEEDFENYMAQFFYSFLFFCMKFGYKFLYSLSGFTLVYKMLFYLDNEVKSQGKDADDLIDSSLLKTSFNSSYGNYREKLKFRALWKFIKKQIYKYLLFVNSIFFVRYFYFGIFSFLYYHGEFWFYLRRSFNDLFNQKILWSTIFLFSSIWKDVSDFYNQFLPMMNEIFYFLVCSCLIFVCYRKNWRLDILLIIGIFIVISGKIIFFVCVWSSNGEDSRYYPSKDFLQYDYYYFREMSLVNLDHFLIGMFFGIGNYSIQKNYVDMNSYKVSKKFLTLPSKLFNFLIRKSFVKSKFILTSLIFILVIFFIIFNFYILTNLIKGDFDKLYFTNFIINVVMIPEMEIVIFLVFILVIESFYLAQGVIQKILKLKFFRLISRTYCSFILIIGFLTNFIFIKSESRVRVKSSVLLFYITLNLVLGIFASIIIYSVIEIPSKKLSKLICTEKIINIEDDEQWNSLGEIIENDSDESSIIKKIS